MSSIDIEQLKEQSNVQTYTIFQDLVEGEHQGFNASLIIIDNPEDQQKKIISDNLTNIHRVLTEKWGDQMQDEDVGGYIEETYFGPGKSLSILVINGEILGLFGVFHGNKEQIHDFLSHNMQSDLIGSDEAEDIKAMKRGLIEKALSNIMNLPDGEEYLIGGDIVLDKNNILYHMDNVDLGRIIHGFFKRSFIEPEIKHIIHNTWKSISDYNHIDKFDIYRFLSLIITSTAFVNVHGHKENQSMIFWTPLGVKKSNMSSIFYSLKLLNGKDSVKANVLLRLFFDKYSRETLNEFGDSISTIYKGDLFNENIGNRLASNSEVLIGVIPTRIGGKLYSGFNFLLSNVLMYTGLRHLNLIYLRALKRSTEEP